LGLGQREPHLKALVKQGKSFYRKKERTELGEAIWTKTGLRREPSPVMNKDGGRSRGLQALLDEKISQNREQ